eukprot:TRINITY_DN26449_c0_g1_i10.p7 TRINITY_DN26449_c0_g1~~TRINITY_DN26449_c0_g1_i10.p7  ORF type:complete len:128 (+),score=0.66 TRINITY_DN26449_c0_g1_i10:1181-1564(+)
MIFVGPILLSVMRNIDLIIFLSGGGSDGLIFCTLYLVVGAGPKVTCLFCILYDLEQRLFWQESDDIRCFNQQVVFQQVFTWLVIFLCFIHFCNMASQQSSEKKKKYDRKSTRLNSSHITRSRMPSSA